LIPFRGAVGALGSVRQPHAQSRPRQEIAMIKNSVSSRVVMVSNFVVIAMVLYWALGDNGPVRRHFMAWKSTINVNRALKRDWTTLIDAKSRIGHHTEAPIIVEFVDYQCPVCVRAHRPIAAFLSQNAHAALIIRHLPLTRIHPEAEPAARLAVCAERFGVFEAAHNYLLSVTPPPARDWDAASNILGVVADSLRTCVNSPETTARLQQDAALASSLGVRATPSFVTQKAVHSGFIDAKQLAALITPNPSDPHRRTSRREGER
jgi:predicted DsbA family dithiol-disulfide isomerase